MIDLSKINHSFNLIKAPINIRRVMPDNKDFIEWLNTGSIDDLRATLKAFEEVQMYEDCAIIAKVLNYKINLIVTRVN